MTLAPIVIAAARWRKRRLRGRAPVMSVSLQENRGTNI
jgi:hypothetical protein